MDHRLNQIDLATKIDVCGENICRIVRQLEQFSDRCVDALFYGSEVIQESPDKLAGCAERII
jgi:hypothetical protein